MKNPEEEDPPPPYSPPPLSNPLPSPELIWIDADEPHPFVSVSNLSRNVPKRPKRLKPDNILMATFTNVPKRLNPDNVLLATFPIDDDDGGFKFKEINVFPRKLTKLGLEDKIRQLMEDAEKIYKRTGMPKCSYMITHFCIPFSYLCARRRQSRLQDLVKAFNDETFDKGIIYLELGCQELTVWMNLPKRKDYCAKRH